MTIYYTRVYWQEVPNEHVYIQKNQNAFLLFFWHSVCQKLGGEDGNGSRWEVEPSFST